MNEDDIISKILNEDTQSGIEYNKNDYNINEVIDSLDMVKDIVDSNNLESNTKLIEKKEMKKEKNKEASKGDSSEAKEDESKKNKKDAQIKIDLEKIKPKDKNENSNKILDSQKKDIDDFYPSFKNPLDFVQYLEVLRNGGQISNEMKSFILQNNRAIDNKYKVLEKNLLSKISNIMTNNYINAIYAKTNILLLSTINGTIFFYTIKRENIKRKVTIPKIQKGVYINCLDITNDYSDLICGFSNGNIVIYSLATEEVKFSNKINNKESPCIELKIYKKDTKKRDIYFISSFGDGQIYFNTYKMNPLNFFKPLSSVPINITDKNPIFMIKFVTFSKENLRLYNNLLEFKRYVILGSLEAITLYCVEPLEEIFIIKKPDFIKECVVPDAQIGIGRPPDVYIRFMKKDENNHLLLVISWGKIIFFYQLPVAQGNTFKDYKEVGNYINFDNILRIGYMNNSVIYCIDKSFTITILDSNKINPGKLEFAYDKPVVSKKNGLPEIEKRNITSDKIISQMKIKDSKNNQKESHLYSIVDNNDSVITIVALAEKQLYNLVLQDWKFFLNSLQSNNDFLNLFSVGIEIYKGKMMALSNLPEEKVKKEQVSTFLKQIVNQYVILNTRETDTEEKISECIRISIEVCIEIEAVEFLLKNIMQLFEAKDYGDLFLEKLQPFILCDKIINIDLSSDIILNLIELYNKNGKLDILSEMLLHINIKSIDTIAIKNKLEEINLIKPLIYLYMNGKKEDYFAPLEKMFYFFYNIAIPSKNLIKTEDNSIDYSDALDKKLITLNEVKNSKEYNGHRILWYIKLCLTGKKFPDNSKKMEQHLFDILVPKIIYWLLTPKVIDEFLKLDPKNYLSIFKNVFTIDVLYKKLLNSAKDTKVVIEAKSSLSSDIKIDDLEPSSLIKYLNEWCKKKDEKDIYYYLYDLIISIFNFNKNIEIEKDLKLESICYILKNFKEIEKNINNEKIKQINDIIINLLDKEKNFLEDDFKYIFKSINDNYFDEIKLFIYDKIDDFQQYLKIYLAKDMDITEKSAKLYKWINNKLEIFSQNYSEKYERLIEVIKENILELAKLSMNKFYELSKEIFSSQNKMILSKLSKDKKIQLGYVELLIKYIITTYENNEYNISSNEMDEIQYILDLHLFLLCELKQYNKIIPALKACPFYPMQKCLERCERLKAYEPCLYIYLKEGSIEKAFQISESKLEETFNLLVDNINSKNDEDKHKELIKNFEEYLSNLRKTCENNDQQLEDLWFKALEILYKFEKKAAEIYKANEFSLSKKNSLDLHQTMGKDIKDLLEKMCSFVGIKHILDIVSEKNKDVGFKEFREILIKILGSYSDLSSLLHSTKNLLTNTVLVDENYFKSLNLKGELLSKQKCGKCHKKFFKNINNKEKIIIYNCNHIFHKDCISKNIAINGPNTGCPICSDLQISKIDNKEKSLIRNNKIFFVDDIKDGKERNNFQIKVAASARKTLQKLEKYDNQDLSKNKLMIRNSMTVLKDQYKQGFS